MVKIRLKRMGAKKRPFYRLVVADARSPRDGRFIEALGFYDPLPDPARVQIDADRVRHWLGRGARPSDRARSLLEQEGVLARSARARRAARGAADGAAAPEAAAEPVQPPAEPAAGGEGEGAGGGAAEGKP